MKIIKILIVIFSAFASNTYSQTTINDILDEYAKNPSRAIEKYLDKATITIKAKITGIYFADYSTSINKIIVHCSSENLKTIDLEDVSLADAIKLNNHDSIIVKGVFSSRPKTSKSIWFSQILIKEAQITQISQDSKWQTELKSEYNCPNCTTDVKKYHDYIVEDILNSIRSEKSFLNKPLSFTLTITEFHKENIRNYIKKGGIGGYVNDGTLKHKIVIYGILQKDQMNLSIGDTIRVTGNLAQSDGSRFADSENNSYDLITLKNCVIKK